MVMLNLRLALFAVFAGWIGGLLVHPVAAADSPEGVELFEKKIRPLLAERCYSCHSAQSKTLQGGLRLDSKPGWRRGGDTGEVVVPGKPDESRLVESVRWSDPDLQMPPENKLPEGEIALLVEWVKRGAPDPREKEPALARPDVSQSYADKAKHWAYQAPKRVPSPTVVDTAWPRENFDQFLLAAMEAKQLRPAAEADRAVLARRVYLDLIGLPPTPEQIDEFLSDASPDAYERLVDRLLASPRFGEHWARHWFDVARFAESVTLRGFIFKQAWRYRDYAIESFNADRPYHQFIREQIAGDLLPHASLAERRRNLTAVTFLTLGNWNLEEQDKKQLDMDVVDEQLDTIGKAFLAQTIGCARCHDHKFDPIPTRDYYALAGILRNAKTLKHANVSEWLETRLPDGREAEHKQHEAAVAALTAEIKAAQVAANALVGTSAEPKPGKGEIKPMVVAAKDLPGVVVDNSVAKAVGAWKPSQWSKHYIGDGYLHDDATGKGERTLTFQPELPKAGRYEVRFAYIHSPSRSTSVPVTIFHAEGETTVPVNEQEPPSIDGRFVSLGKFRFEANGFGHVLVSNEGTKGHVTADAVQFLPAEEGEKSTSQPAPQPNKTIADAAGKLKSLEQRLAQLQKNAPPSDLIMMVREAEKIEDAKVHIRGSVHTLGEIAPRGFLSVAAQGEPPEIPAGESGRRELAAWIASDANPLTARVVVNRAWQQLFGEGLVRTTENFGTTGDVPSHLELLDELALRFVEEGWSLKSLVRRLVLTRAYRQSTVGNAPQGAVGNAHASAVGNALRGVPKESVDPDNRLLTHMNRRRLTAEALRDAILAVSGELRLELGGPTFPLDRASDFNFQYSGSRRSVYAPVFRNALPEIFEVFDFAEPSMVVGRRSVSTVPTQALFLLNSPWVREQARLAAARSLAESAATDADRLDMAFRRALGRLPSETERKIALGRLAGATDRIEAWTDVVQTLFACLDFRYVN